MSDPVYLVLVIDRDIGVSEVLAAHFWAYRLR